MVVIGLLAVAAFLWGNVLKADTVNSTTQNASPASASFYSDSLGVSAANASRASAAFYSDSLGVSAVRASSASAPF